MAANKQCLYRSQEHECKIVKEEILKLNACNRCLRGQTVDAIELVASAIMKQSIDSLEEEAHQKEQVDELWRIAKKYPLLIERSE